MRPRPPAGGPGLPSAVELICRSLLAQEPEREASGRDAHAESRRGALQLLPRYVKYAGAPVATAPSAATFVVRCLSARAAVVRVAAADALTALTKRFTAADTGLEAYTALVVGSRAAISASPGAFAEVLSAADLPADAHATPFMRTSAPSTLRMPLPTGEAAGVAHDSVLAGVAF